MLVQNDTGSKGKIHAGCPRLSPEMSIGLLLYGLNIQIYYFFI